MKECLNIIIFYLISLKVGIHKLNLIYCYFTLVFLSTFLLFEGKRESNIRATLMFRKTSTIFHAFFMKSLFFNLDLEAGRSAIAQSFIAFDFIVLCFVVVEDVERE